jgi:ParB-like chromosome segregation protein Spo0J
MAIEFNCVYDELIPADKLEPNPQNPNHHTSDQLEMLAGLISRHGWRSPVIVSKLTGRIVAGHGRHKAAGILMQDDIPVVYQEFGSESEENAYLVADNYISELSNFDPEKIKDVIEGMGDGFDLSLAGYTERDFQSTISSLLDQGTAFEKRRGLDQGEDDDEIDLCCPTCGFEWTAVKGSPSVMVREGSKTLDSSPFK